MNVLIQDSNRSYTKQYTRTKNIGHSRALRLIKECIEKLNVNLKGYNVLTEVGTNAYLYTPLIAALAGADKVLAWTADTHYGLGETIKEECLKVADQAGVFLQLTISNLL